MSIQEPRPQKVSDSSSLPLVLPFSAIDASMLAQVGGKAANLGELTRAHFQIPPGFCVTTEAYLRAAEAAGLAPVLAQLASVPETDSVGLESWAAEARSLLGAVSIPDVLTQAINEAYQLLAPAEPIPVAVRSSATAEDLPFASFAGQQDTYLNILGIDAVLEAVRRCWASLWTNRAVSYRARNGIDPRAVRLAVVVQRMVEAQVAGVLFTANPLTGRRHQAVIDASPGLGEAVVSGAVNPDHFVVDTESSTLLEWRLGDKTVAIRSLPGGGTQRVELEAQNEASCLSDEQIQQLAGLGARVEAHYGTPQDTEWALDAAGQFWLTQARPITTLYPLPDSAPVSTQDLRVYFSINVAQGVYRPFTPMGTAIFYLATSSGARFLRLPPRDNLAGPGLLVEAGQRLFVNATVALRSRIGRQLLPAALGIMEARSAPIVKALFADPRLSILYPSRGPFVRKMLVALLFGPAAWRLLQALVSPSATRKRLMRQRARLEAKARVPANASASQRLETLERLVLETIGPTLLGNLPAIMGAGLGLFGIASSILRDIATPDELQTILRSLPYNVTTEMDLKLWNLAQEIRADGSASRFLLDTPLEQVVRAYPAKTLPTVLQAGLERFLREYGHRGVAEIDAGLPRWSEDPAHILGVLVNYLQLENPALAPDVQFKRGEREAEAMLQELTQRARQKLGWLRGKQIQYFLRQARALGGLREMPKFYLVLILAGTRRLLWPVGEELAQAGRLASAEDIFFLYLTEVHRALKGEDFREVVPERRAVYEQEMGRRHIPRILLSDGTEPEAELQRVGSATGNELTGSPASAGIVTAKARVILNPVGARLEPGEILVAPSTDPGWTPLFLTAGGLVMEMGGSMSHGSVVAREYGIPAVVGVHGAIEHITTGQLITVNGSSGLITLEPDKTEDQPVAVS